MVYNKRRRSGLSNQKARRVMVAAMALLPRAATFHKATLRSTARRAFIKAHNLRIRARAFNT